jgi:hypothetical protein
MKTASPSSLPGMAVILRGTTFCEFHGFSSPQMDSTDPLHAESVEKPCFTKLGGGEYIMRTSPVSGMGTHMMEVSVF